MNNDERQKLEKFAAAAPKVGCGLMSLGCLIPIVGFVLIMVLGLFFMALRAVTGG